MKADVVLAGVGGQGVVTVARLLAEAGRRQGLVVKQSELHGMARRGGAVQAMVRLADHPIGADVVATGAADLLVALEPLEGLRSIAYLRPGGAVVAATEPVKNIADYPPLPDVIAELREVPGSVLVDTRRLAREAGSGRAANMVMVGAAAARLPLQPAILAECIRAWSVGIRPRHADANVAAFHLGLGAARPTVAPNA